MAKMQASGGAKGARVYKHPEEESLLRPEIGVQANFKQTRDPVDYRYDSSLSPEMQWDEHPARAQAEALLLTILDAKNLTDAREAASKLKKLGEPFLNWAGKAEHQAFTVPTLPLFTHEHLATQAILETLKGHTRDRQLDLALFDDPQHSIRDQTLKAYEYKDKWRNRLVLGDSLVVMNSLLHWEGMGGQVHMVYMDPPYGVRFGSNFQPFVRSRNVAHGADDALTREPEMVQAYRDTWELGLHSYLTYLRDRLLLARELLAPRGSIFLQISDDHVHHVREVLDEVFGRENFIAQIIVQKSGGLGSSDMKSVADYLLWYARDREQADRHITKLYQLKRVGEGEGSGARYDQVEEADGTRRPMTTEERSDPRQLPPGARPYQLDNLTSGAFRINTTVDYVFEGETFHPGPNACWKTTVEGLDRLVQLGRIVKAGKTLRYVRYIDDFPAVEITNLWNDVAGAGDKLYVVQTSTSVIERCILMATKPGDLVFDPTCGSGTTPYVAERWGRRWIATDVSRVPLALARQRLLTATHEWYELQDEARGPAGGFVYEERQNRRGEESGGIIPHVTLGSLANDEPTDKVVLVDQPKRSPKVTRVTGPFLVEGTIPGETSPDAPRAPIEGMDDEESRRGGQRLLAALRYSPTLHLGGGRKVTLQNIRVPRSLYLSAEATIEGEDGRIAFVFGPESGMVSERLVNDAAREAHMKGYTQLVVLGYGIQPEAHAAIQDGEAMYGLPVAYAQATMDLWMSDLLKTMRSSQIFSVCGLPDVVVRKVAPERKGGAPRYSVELVGLDTFDPIEMKPDHIKGADVPAWFLDTSYNGMAFHVSQAFFPRTSAWENLKKALKTEYEPSVWAHLAGTTSTAFEAGEHDRIAVKVIDTRGNELLKVCSLREAKG